MYVASISVLLSITCIYLNNNANAYESGQKVPHNAKDGSVESSEQQNTEPLVTTTSGSFRGSLLSSRRGRTIYSFRGIRFAEAPTGELRFQAPRLISHYSSPVDASKDGPACPQPGNWLGETSEDCLRLNVYSPSLPRPNSQTRKLTPVLVYFHAGGFYSASAQSFLDGPEYLLDHDVTLVTVNYRLGSLGFIATGDKWAPGNLGLKDQVAALRWIQQNIAGFGGDTSQVTIIGYSAGSRSVTLHMLSPMSKGLFHRAIAMSAAGTMQSKVASHQMNLAEKQARLVGCPDTSSEAIITCLKTKDQHELGNSLSGFYVFYRDPVLIFKPVVEPDVGQERFLTDEPENLIRAGKINDVPLIIGMTEQEFAGKAFTLLLNKTASEEMDNNWNEIAPISFQYERNTSNSAKISQGLRKYYLGDRKLVYDNDTAFALGRLYGDGVTAFAVHRFANLMAQHLRSPVYYYKFNYTGDQSYFYYPGTKTPIGVVHHDDLLSLFNISRLFKPKTLQSPHSHMVDKMTTMWTNFATYGNPNPVKNQPALSGLNWPVMTPSERKFLQINKEFSVQANMFEERFRVWENLFPLKSYI